MKTPDQPSWRRFFAPPSTRLGRWAAALAAIFAVLYLLKGHLFVSQLVVIPESANTVIMPAFGIFMLLCGLASGIVGLLAVIRKGERSWMVWLPILFGLFVLLLVIGEVVVPH